MRPLVRWLYERWQLRGIPRVTERVAQGLTRQGAMEIEEEARHLRRLLGAED